MSDLLQKSTKTRYQQPVTLALSSIIALVAAIIIVQDFSLQTATLSMVITWMTCLLTFVLADLLAGEIERGLWAGYLYLTTVVTWLTLGLAAGLAIIIIGASLAMLIRQRELQADYISPIHSCTPKDLFLLRLIISGAA